MNSWSLIGFNAFTVSYCRKAAALKNQRLIGALNIITDVGRRRNSVTSSGRFKKYSSARQPATTRIYSRTQIPHENRWLRLTLGKHEPASNPSTV